MITKCAAYHEQQYNKALDFIGGQCRKIAAMRSLLEIVIAEVEPECTCNQSQDRCLHCRIKATLSQ